MHAEVTRKLGVLKQTEGASAIAPWAIVLAEAKESGCGLLCANSAAMNARSSLRRSSGPSRCWATRWTAWV